MRIRFIVYIFSIKMRNKVLLLLAAVLLASCGWPESSTSYAFDEKSNEVMLTDLFGLEFRPVCSVSGKEKKCGAVFYDFTVEFIKTTSYMEYSTTDVVIPGFKKASILSLQVKDENSGEVKPLLSYKQSDIPYTKGSTFVPSVMELRAETPPTEYTLSGYYEGDEWIEHDTTISIGDTLFANDDGLLKFSVQDRFGNKASLEVNFGKVLENNDAGTVMSRTVSGGVSYTYDFWAADSGSIAFKALDINFEPLKPKVSAYMQYMGNSTDTTTMPFLRLVFPPFYKDFYHDDYDSLILNGGTNKKILEITVVDYAK